MLNLLNLIEIFAVALAPHVVAMDEPERRGIDAVAQATAINRAVREEVAEVAVAVSRPNLGPDHPVRGVPQLIDVAETIGLVKLGHLQPDSNLSDDAKRGSPETMST
jgi:hypothetical protein